jgi:outer membrane protein OmpA-like peptidoglycan-associated protein
MKRKINRIQARILCVLAGARAIHSVDDLTSRVFANVALGGSNRRGAMALVSSEVRVLELLGLVQIQQEGAHHSYQLTALGLKAVSGQRLTQHRNAALKVSTVAVLGTLATSCTTLGMHQTVPAAYFPEPPGKTVHIEQVRGADGRYRFQYCYDDGCPKPTPKISAGSPLSESPTVRRLPPPSDTALVARDASSERPTTNPLVKAIQYPAPAQAAREPQKEHENYSVFFNFGKADLTPAAMKVLKQSALNSVSAEKITVTGRTDKVGPPAFNQWLAHARAESVVKTMARLGVRPTAIEVKTDISGDSVLPGDAVVADVPTGMNQRARRVDVSVDKRPPASADRRGNS